MKIVLFVIGGIGGLVALLLALNFAGTVSSVATAPGRVIQRTMETNNIITNYEWFHQTHAAYTGRVSQIRVHKSLLASETDQIERNRLRIVRKNEDDDE